MSIILGDTSVLLAPPLIVLQLGLGSLDTFFIQRLPANLRRTLLSLIVRNPMRVRRRLEPAPERHCLQDIAHALLPDRRELALALHQQHPREPERVHAQLLARAREHVRLVPPRHDVDVLKREQDVVGRGAGGVRRVVAHGLDREVERGEEGVGERGLELVRGGEGERRGQAADVVCVGQRRDAEWAT